MKTVALISLFVCTFTLVFAQEPSPMGQNTAATTADHNSTSVNELISSWPEMPRQAAQKLIAKYGPPNEQTPSMLTWNNNGPWKRTILYKQEIPHEFPSPHTDFLEQFVAYRVPPDKFDDLAKYDGSVIVERTKGEMSARCDKEELNMLALNLANDVVTGKRSVDDAREYYAKTAMAFKQGKSDPYTDKLQFPVQQAGTADPDHPASMKAEMSQR
jgi:hypothetical protein